MGIMDFIESAVGSGVDIMISHGTNRSMLSRMPIEQLYNQKQQIEKVIYEHSNKITDRQRDGLERAIECISGELSRR